MKQYHDLLARVLSHGVDIPHQRTGLPCRTLIGQEIKFDFADGFPLLTSRKLSLRSIVGELLGFFRGYTSAADFRALGCPYWDANANISSGWLSNPNRKGEDDLGPIYGKQWTAWRAYREVSSSDAAAADRLFDNGFHLVSDDGQVSVFRKEINQLEATLSTLLADPTDRRLIVSGWNVGELDLMALPPCHMDYTFVALPEQKTLHVDMHIRSWDLYLGGPANIASTAIFLAIMARLAGYQPGTVTIHGSNVHIYGNHFDQVKEIITRQPPALPTLALSERIRPVRDASEIAGIFARIEPDDIAVEGYESLGALPAPMAP